MNERQQAAALNEEALGLQKKRHLRDAVRVFREAIAADPTWSVPLYNLGLLYKNERKWRSSLICNRRAARIEPDNEASWWNLGIAATATGRWQTARAAWKGFGLTIPEGRGPIDLPCGFGPVRLNPQSDAEVVWAHRLDPARAKLASIPFPESGFRWQDTVLNDGAPSGFRTYQGQEVPVLDVLELLQPSRYGTYVAQVAVLADGKPDEKLAELADKMGGAAEDWTTSTRILCKACSEGRPHREHDTDAAPPEGIHLIGIAARNRGVAGRILHTWETDTPGVEVQGLQLALEAGRKGKK